MVQLLAGASERTVIGRFDRLAVLGDDAFGSVENTLAGYPPAPYYVGGILPISLAASRSGDYAITVRAGLKARSVELECLQHRTEPWGSQAADTLALR